MTTEAGGQSSNYHSITLRDGLTPFRAEFKGPENPELTVVIVDSISTTDESRGLLQAIEDRVPSNALLIKGDLSGASRNGIIPISRQADRLTTIMENARSRIDVVREVYLARTLGAVPIALHRPSNSDVLLLNPPMDSAFHPYNPINDEQLAADESEDLETLPELDPEDKYIIDNYIYLEKELTSLNLSAFYELLARRNQVSMIVAGAAMKLSSQPIIEGVKWAFLPGADKNFTGIHREGLLKLFSSYYQVVLDQHRSAEVSSN